MLNDISNLNLKNQNINLNLNDEMMSNLYKDFEKDNRKKADHNPYPDSSIPTTISSIKKKINLGNNSVKKVSDTDLLTSMTKRLNIIEKQLSDERKGSRDAENKLKQLTTENTELKHELQNYKTMADQANIDGKYCANCNKLNTYIINLSNYAEELREFIKENGFILINPMPILENYDDHINAKEIITNNKNKELNKSTVDNIDDYDSDDSYLQLLPKEIDVDILSRRIEELNMLLLKDGQISRFEMDGDKIFKLKRQKELKFFFYKNGLIIEGYKFYEYSSIEAKKILHDILDGYTPYILKNDYSDGVLLTSVNNVHMIYTNQNNISSNLKFINDPNEKKDKISGKEFLMKFPEKVIRNGKIYNIRDDMENFLVVKRENEYNLDECEYFVNFEKEKENELKESIVKLKIKILIIDKIITVNVLKIFKMKVLFEFMQKFLKSSHKQTLIENFCFYSTYPLKLYFMDDEKTFEENGLFPSYFLMFDLKEKFVNN